jgi:hypothetical protein
MELATLRDHATKQTLTPNHRGIWGGEGGHPFLGERVGGTTFFSWGEENIAI